MEYNVKIKLFKKDYLVYTYRVSIRKGFKRRFKTRKMIYDDFTLAKKKARQNLNKSVSRTKNKVFDLARANSHSFFYFVTLTFDPLRVNSYDYRVVGKEMTKWLSLLKKKYPSLAYLGVPELHKSGRYHFHFLMSDISEILTDSTHKTSTGDIIYNLDFYDLGFSTATKIYDKDRVTRYIAKYLTKDLLAYTKNKKRYWHSYNLRKPTELYFLQDDLEAYHKGLFSSARFHKKISNTEQEVNIFDTDTVSF